MCGAQGAIAHSGADPDQLHRVVGVSDIVLDLLERARGQEARRRDGKNLSPRVSQSGRDPDQVLLGNTDFNQLCRECARKSGQARRPTGITRNDEQPRVLLCRGLECFREDVEIGSAEGESQLTRPLEGRGGEHRRGRRAHERTASASSAMDASISPSACAYSWSFGTPWCHFATSSMKETPRPFTVSARTAVGFPAGAGAARAVLSACRSWPSTILTDQPNASNLSARGSLLQTSRVRPLICR